MISGVKNMLRKCLLVSLIAVVGFSFSGCGCDEDHPVTYKGRPLSYWIKMLQSKDSKKQKEAAIACRAIGSHAKEATPYLRKALTDDHPHVRSEAAKALGEIRCKNSVAELIKASKDTHEKVRISAVQALSEIEAKKSVPALIQALKDKSAQVRIYAANGLGDIGDPRALPALKEALKDKNTHDAAEIAIKKINQHKAA